MPKKKLLTWFFSGCILLLMSLAIYQTFNYSSYQETIANITKVTITNQENRQDEKQNTDTHYEQTLTLKILNGSHRGETMTTINHYSQSQISNHPYHKGNKVFVKINATTPNAVTIIDRKRDTALLILTTIFLIFLFMIAKKRGLFIFISLCLNSIIIGLLLIFYRQQPNNWLLPLIGLISPLLILSTLFLLNGWSKKTQIAATATLIGTLCTFIIGYLVITLLGHQGLHYEQMELITRPPQIIFLSSLLIGCLGGVMDIAVTITAALTEVKKHQPKISKAQLIQAGKSIGQEITGPMTNIMIFSYLSGAIPLIIIFLKNKMSFNYTFSIVLSLELARALVGSIGIVLAVPLTIYLASYWLGLKEGKIDVR